MENLEYGIMDWSEEIQQIEYAMDHLEKAVEEIEGFTLFRGEIDDLKDVYNNLQKLLKDLNEVQAEYESKEGKF